MLRRSDLLWRAVIGLAALASSLLSAPMPALGILVLTALALSAERLARRRGRDPLDALLVGTGGILVTLVLVGLVLGATSIGLRTHTWSVALSLVALLGIVVAVTRPRPAAAEPAQRRTRLVESLRILPWAAASVAVIAFAVTTSVNAVAPTEAAPLQMSFGAVDGTQVEVVVSSSTITGPLELRSNLDGTEVSYPLFTVNANGTHSTTVALPASGRFVVTLSYPDQTQPLRSLTLDR